MTWAARFWLLFLLLAVVLAGTFRLIAQSPPQTQTTPSPESSAGSLQGLLDRSNYIAYADAMADVNAAGLTESQRQYFLGMLAFHLGKLDEAAPLLIKGVNINDGSLKPQQVESALETLGQINLKLTYFDASAKMYADIEKAWGGRMGVGAQAIHEKRDLAALLRVVPKQTIKVSGDFSLQRSALEYPVSIPAQPNKQYSAEFDTGAEISVLSASTAKAWGVTMLDGSATLHGYGGGSFAAQPGFIPALVIGRAELHNVAAYVTADENLYVAQIKRQTNALLGYSVVAALGRLTFAQDGSLTISAQSPPRDLNASAALWLSGHSLLVELGTQPIPSGGKLAASTGARLFMLDTGSGSTYLTDRYLAEHRDVFHGAPPESAILAGAGGVREIPAFGARNVPLFAGGTVILLNGPHVLSQSTGGESEDFFGLIGQDVLGLFTSYTIDFRNMTLTVTR